MFLDAVQDPKDLVKSEVGEVPNLFHHVTLTDESPNNARPYRIPFAFYQEGKHTIDEMVKKGILRRSTLDYICPAFFTMKISGALNLLCDFFALNKVT